MSDTCTVTVQTVTYLFQDAGVIGNYNTNYVNTNNGVQAVVGNTGTTISCSTYADCYRYANVLISGDFKVTITFVDSTDWGCDIALLSSSKTKMYYIQRADAPYKWQGQVGNGSTFTINSSYSPIQDSPVTYERVGSTMTVKANGNLIDSRTITTDDVYFALKTHSAGNRNFTFKDLTIEQL